MEGRAKLIRNGAIIAGIIVALFGLTVVALLLQQNKPKSFSATYSDMLAKAPVNPGSCLSLIDNIALRVPSAEQSEIFNAASVAITDLPAGTKLTVNFATYDGKNASGTVMYGSNFGNYNFTAQKEKGSSNWLISTYVACM